MPLICTLKILLAGDLNAEENEIILFESKFLGVIGNHATKKKKVARATVVPYMKKALRKAVADRSRLENRYQKSKTEESLRAYKQQKNFCSRLYKKERKKYYTNLDLKKITDCKLFRKTAMPFFSDKCVVGNNIVLIEGEEIYQEDQGCQNSWNFFNKR